MSSCRRQAGSQAPRFPASDKDEALERGARPGLRGVASPGGQGRQGALEALGLASGVRGGGGVPPEVEGLEGDGAVAVAGVGEGAVFRNSHHAALGVGGDARRRI